MGETSKVDLTPNKLLHAYAAGVFPMAHPEEADAVYWYAPDPRAIIPLETFKVSKNLAKLIKRNRFAITSDLAFEEVMRRCASPAKGREQTWISDEIIAAYCQLHALGFAHSVETRLDGELVGGLYGVAIGGAFFGESMFHTVTDASKVALVHLVDRMEAGGFRLLDIQFMTEHLRTFGAIEVPRAHYERLLVEALSLEASWDLSPLNQ